MIDKTTGTVTVENLTISKVDTKSSFLTKNSTLILDTFNNNEWITYRLINFQEVIISLIFNGEKLKQIHLVSIDPNSGGDWNSWSIESEKVRKQIHDKWLTTDLYTQPYVYEWGKVDSVYDDKSGCSQIIIHYTE